MDFKHLNPRDDDLMMIYARLSSRMEFINDIKNYFGVKHICRLLNIDRNRYYYLRRTNQLTLALCDLYDHLQGDTDHEQSQ